jgi:hypothetical protein
MRTLYPLAVVVAVGLTLIIFGATGFSAALGQQSGSGSAVADAVNDSSQNSAVDSGVTGAGNSDGSLFGMIVNAGQSVLGYAQMILYFPSALTAIGVPSAYAFPIGGIVEVIVGIGVFQFILGRNYR